MRFINLIIAFTAFLATPLVASPNAALESRTTVLQYSDAAVAPDPATAYERLFTLLATGTRTYSCLGGKFTLTDLNYNLYDATNLTKGLLGRRVYMAAPDPSGGVFAHYSK
jgi:hypothetical protein